MNEQENVMTRNVLVLGDGPVWDYPETVTRALLNDWLAHDRPDQVLMVPLDPEGAEAFAVKAWNVQKFNIEYYIRPWGPNDPALSDMMIAADMVMIFARDRKSKLLAQVVEFADACETPVLMHVISQTSHKGQSGHRMDAVVTG